MSLTTSVPPRLRGEKSAPDLSAITPAKPMVRVPRPMSVEEMSDLVLGHPKVDDGFVQHIETLDQKNAVRVPGGAGSWIKSQTRACLYRCYILAGDKIGECSIADIVEAAKGAFAQARVDLPARLVEIIQKRTEAKS